MCLLTFSVSALSVPQSELYPLMFLSVQVSLETFPLPKHLSRQKVNALSALITVQNSLSKVFILTYAMSLWHIGHTYLITINFIIDLLVFILNVNFSIFC